MRRMSLVSAAVLTAIGGQALAAPMPSDPAITIRAMSGALSGQVTIPVASLSEDFPSVLWSYSSLVDVNINDTVTGQPIAQINELFTEIFNGFSLGIFESSIALGYKVTAGSADTIFEISTTSFSFPAISGAASSASSTFVLRDNNGNGASATGLFPGGAMHRAVYNGDQNTGTEFVSLLMGGFAIPGGEAGTQDNFGVGGNFVPTGVPVFDMQYEYRFLLSAGDRASVTSIYGFVPTPGAIALGVLGVFAAARRRR